MAGKKIPAGEFKARCLKVMERVAATGEGVIVTKRGRPVVRVVPAGDDSRPFVGRLSGTATHIGDIVRPIDEPWEASAD